MIDPSYVNPMYARFARRPFGIANQARRLTARRLNPQEHCLSPSTAGGRYRETVLLRAGHATGNVRATGVLLAPRHRDARPGPPGASTGPANDHNVIPAAGDRTRPGNSVEGQACDGDTRAGCAAVEVPAVVVLLDEDAVPWRREGICQRDGCSSTLLLALGLGQRRLTS